MLALVHLAGSHIGGHRSWLAISLCRSCVRSVAEHSRCEDGDEESFLVLHQRCDASFASQLLAAYSCRADSDARSGDHVDGLLV